MAVYYSRPRLKSLSQGDRIAFVRQLRRVSQHELGVRIGIKNLPRNQVCRIERKSRDIRPDRLEKITTVLNVNAAMLRRWDFEDPADLFYQLLWVEELCPDFFFRNTIRVRPCNETHAILSDKYQEWKEMRRKYGDMKISYEEYWEWKLTKA